MESGTELIGTHSACLSDSFLEGVCLTSSDLANLGLPGFAADAVDEVGILGLLSSSKLASIRKATSGASLVDLLPITHLWSS